VQVAQIVQPGVGQRPFWSSDRFVVGGDQLAHQRGHGVGVKRFAPLGGEDQAADVSPGRTCGLPFRCLTATVLPQDGDSFTVDADHAGPAALGGFFHALAAHYGGGAAERDLSGVQVDRLPAEVEQLTAASASVGSEPVEGI
jgi:hypothetical protein